MLICLKSNRWEMPTAYTTEDKPGEMKNIHTRGSAARAAKDGPFWLSFVFGPDFADHMDAPESDRPFDLRQLAQGEPANAKNSSHFGWHDQQTKIIDSMEGRTSP